MDKHKSNTSHNKLISHKAIIYSIERDINDLLLEISVRTQRDKLHSIKDTLKILLKTLNSSKGIEAESEDKDNNNNNNPNAINKGKSPAKSKNDDNKTFKSLKTISFQRNQITTIEPIKESNEDKKEIFLRKSYHPHNIISLKQNEHLRLSDLKTQIKTNTTNESNEDNRKLTKRIKALEAEIQQVNQTLSTTKEEYNSISLENNDNVSKLQNSLKLLNEEYDKVCLQLNKSQEENTKYHQQELNMKRAYCELKHKVDKLATINERFTSKLMQNEFDHKQMSEQLRVANNKIANMRIIISDLESKNENMLNELNTKEHRLNVLRNMNNALENKSIKLIKKLDEVKYEDSKSNHYCAYQKYKQNTEGNSYLNVMHSRLSTEAVDNSNKSIEKIRADKKLD